MLLDYLPLRKRRGGFIPPAIPDVRGSGHSRSSFALSSRVSGLPAIGGSSEVVFSLSISVNGQPDMTFARKSDEASLIALGVL